MLKQKEHTQSAWERIAMNAAIKINPLEDILKELSFTTGKFR
jgi:hypothetical protein